jgi:hypothetical protein
MIGIRFLVGFRDLPGRSAHAIYCALAGRCRGSAAPLASPDTVALDLPSRTLALAFGAGAVALAVWVSVDAGAAPLPGCSAFVSQAAAQEYFVEHDGSPRQPVGDLDDDRDGVACETLPAPFAGFATLNYNPRKKLFYGSASMSPPAAGSEGFPCLYGNRSLPTGPRRLGLYKVLPGADRLVRGPIGAEARIASARLVWKASIKAVGVGSYYAMFEEKIRLSPYGPSECPGFRSRQMALP